MRFDLHDALSAAVPEDLGAPNMDAAWQQARRERRQRSFGALAAATVVLLGAVFVVIGGSDQRRISTPATSDQPGSILALRSGELVELSIDGSTKRVIAGSPGTPSEGGGLSVSSDGTIAIAPLPNTDPSGVRQCPDSTTRSGYLLSRVDLATGNTSKIELPATAGGAIDPTLSPDGTRFAYVEYQCQPLGTPTLESRRANALVVRDVSGNEQFRFALPLTSPDDGHHLEIISIAGWEPDGHSVLVLVQHEPTGELWRIDTEGNTPAVELAGPEDILAASVTPIGNTGRWLTNSFAGGFLALPPEIVEYNPDTGVAINTLFKWSTLPAGAGGNVVASDPTGRHLLLVASLNGGSQVLYRWSEGDAQPTKIAENVTQAVWLPTASAESPTTTSSTTSPEPGQALGLTVQLPKDWQLQAGSCPAPRTVVVLDAVADLPAPAGCGEVTEPWAVVQRVPADLDGIDTECSPSYFNGMPTCRAIERDLTSADGFPGTERRLYVGLDVFVSIHRTTSEGPSDAALDFRYAEPRVTPRFPYSVVTAQDAMERILAEGCVGLGAEHTSTLEAQCTSLDIPSGARFESTFTLSPGGAVPSEYVGATIIIGDSIMRYRLLVAHRWNRDSLGLDFFIASINRFEGPPPDIGCEVPPQDPRFINFTGDCPPPTTP